MCFDTCVHRVLPLSNPATHQAHTSCEPFFKWVLGFPFGQLRYPFWLSFVVGCHATSLIFPFNTLLHAATQVRAMLANPAKFAPSRSLPPLAFNTFHWDPDVLSTLGINSECFPLALITSKDKDLVSA